MAHALESVEECTILKAHPLLTFQEGQYSYRIERIGTESNYSVSDGTQNETFPIRWAFGQGFAGQTYVVEKGGEYYQSRVSFYRDTAALDLTLGAENIKPRTMDEAIGIPMKRSERVGCFGCHATNAVIAKQLVLEKMVAGVQCERCHGSSDNHLLGIKQGNAKLAAMPILKAFSAEQMATFCGQCHRTWDEIAASGKLGISNVRFQPYRLANSKCYNPEDRRISCVGCHDPHQEVDHETSHYDKKCLACHAGGKAGARACKVSSKSCTTCHMPKIEIPNSHHRFSDHEIRIVKAHVYPD